MSVIRRWWKGEERLVIVYWGSMAILAALYFVGFAAEGTPTPERWQTVGVAVLLLYIPVAAFCIVSIWSCAFNVKWRVWGYLARIQAAVMAINLIGAIIQSFG
jgi:hypothetical protein